MLELSELVSSIMIGDTVFIVSNQRERFAISLAKRYNKKFVKVSVNGEIYIYIEKKVK